MTTDGHISSSASHSLRLHLLPRLDLNDDWLPSFFLRLSLPSPSSSPPFGSRRLAATPLPRHSVSPQRLLPHPTIQSPLRDMIVGLQYRQWMRSVLCLRVPMWVIFGFDFYLKSRVWLLGFCLFVGNRFGFYF
ncbi:hypothetical protein IHE45_19G038100 [Dioscorea alata]|uniref:Uncharacterized protein n=1 Tax=Dioscorea alata TaxID=55571 RepID=A0ACB7TXH3_DIOAL|nr:hypothetical protein IHE45_19G038100 [Dioscorea alata]